MCFIRTPLSLLYGVSKTIIAVYKIPENGGLYELPRIFQRAGKNTGELPEF